MGHYWNVIAVWAITQHLTENIDFEIGAKMQILKKVTFLCDCAKTVPQMYHRSFTT